jgi:hypothetical protein
MTLTKWLIELQVRVAACMYISSSLLVRCTAVQGQLAMSRWLKTRSNLDLIVTQKPLYS